MSRNEIIIKNLTVFHMRDVYFSPLMFCLILISGNQEWDSAPD